jgi:hypothetical protein
VELPWWEAQRADAVDPSGSMRRRKASWIVVLVLSRVFE